ncbi:MAG: tRNA lysidine(34) synthetase TilS, partial [Cyanobacteriota bacterium]
MKQKTIKTIELVNFLHHLVNEKKLLIANQSIVLAVSGGQDSICLFFIFLQLKTQWGWNISLIYCNHLWQKDSFYTMLHIFKLAYLLNVPIYFTITLQKILSEQKARNWRSLTFHRITQFYMFSVIVTGHSKSDQIETGLFNIFRGSGTKGVTSLKWIKAVNKRCFFNLNRTQLKNLKNLYRTETTPNILLTPDIYALVHIHPKDEGVSGVFVNPLEMLEGEKGNVSRGVTDTIKINVRKKSQKRFFKFVSKKIKNKTSIKINLLKSTICQTLLLLTSWKNVSSSPIIKNKNFYYGANKPSNVSNISFRDVRDVTCKPQSMTLYKNVNNDLHLFDTPLLGVSDCVSKITHLENNVLLVLRSRPCQNTVSYAYTISVAKQTPFLTSSSKMSGVRCWQTTLGDVRKPNISLIYPLLMSEFASTIAKHPFRMSGLQTFLLSVNKKQSFKFVKIKQEKTEILPLYKTKYTLVRPFLSFTRFDLKKLCISWKIPLFPDQSNQKVKYQRNRIRKQLLPTLRFFFNPQIDTVLYQFIDIIKNEEEYINFITARIIKKIEQEKEKSVELETSLFAVLPIAIRRKIMKHFLNNIMKKSLTFFDVEKSLKQISISKSVKPQKNFLKKQEKVNKNIFKNVILNSSNPPLTYYKTKVINTQQNPFNISFFVRSKSPTSLLRSRKELSNVSDLSDVEERLVNYFAQNLLTLDISALTPPLVVLKGGKEGLPYAKQERSPLLLRSKTPKGVLGVGTSKGIAENLFVKEKFTKKKVLRVHFAHQKAYKSKICIINHDFPKENNCFPNIPNKTKGFVKGCQENHESFSVPFAQLKKQTNKIVDKKTSFFFPLKTKNLPLLANQRCVSSILQKDILLNLINKRKSIYKEYKLIFFPKTGSFFLEAER